MSRQPRFEEIDDIDDPEELDLPSFGGGSSSLLSRNDLPQPSTGGMPASADGAFKPHMISQQDLEQFKSWSCVYPVYFDVSRTLREGRRVPLALATQNPMAKELAEAAASLGIQSVFEVSSFCQGVLNNSLTKRIRKTGQIQVASESGRKGVYQSKQELYAALAGYLQKHPVTKESPMKVQIPGLQVDKIPSPPAVPKGWKINEILPVYSPALSGGGVSDNLMRDLMREEGMPEPVVAKKKGKKK